MWFYVKLAWRNILRNRRRTVIASMAIGIGLASLIFSDALMKGMADNMIHSATASLLGEGQIHAEDFRETQEVELTVKQYPETLSRLQTHPLVKRATPRAISFAMLTSSMEAQSVVAFGINPGLEPHLSQIDDSIREGNYLNDPEKREILIGSKLAEILEVELGDRLVLTVAQAGSGDLSQEMYRLSGIYHFSMDEMDNGMVFVHLHNLQKMLAIEGRVHQIAVTFKDAETAGEKNLPFWDEFSGNGNEAVSWITLLPQLKAVFDMTDISLLIMGVILFAVVTFGIINTLFMSLYERMFEFGVMRAVGTRPWGMGKLVLLEAGALAFLSVIVGAVLGLLLTLLVTKTGIDYRGVEFAGATIRDLLYPVLQVEQFIKYPAGVFLFTLLVGLYPAWYAARMKISDSLRKSL